MCKIISVGNISMGGTGKTPFTIYLGTKLLEEGYNVCILSRGYKGRIGLDTRIIHDGEKFLYSSHEAADEPYLIASRLKTASVITGKNRNKSFDLAKEIFKPDFVILDDGFQHRQIVRDVDIVLLDHKKPLSTGFVFPFGYLRESPSALKRANIVVFTRADDEIPPPGMERFLADKPVFFSKTEINGLYRGGLKITKNELKDAKVFAFSGIASNKKFIEMLYEMGLNVKGCRFYPDHHRYSFKDIAKLKSRKNNSGADLFITTEKDYVKLSPEMQDETVYVRISMSVKESSDFWKVLAGQLNEGEDITSSP